jgi:hypothetical protein
MTIETAMTLYALIDCRLIKVQEVFKNEKTSNNSVENAMLGAWWPPDIMLQLDRRKRARQFF